ncbi:hypothetical protein B0H13DRAFT_2298702 [Mycena leptocephala]|nr:hypothetical protein B0H13DRAFT_2298702 [Mycena leptocephala]
MVHASDILSEREYLLKDFDPNHLSVSVLAGVLAFHAIEIPSKRNKKELVTLWKLNITERRVKLLKEHDARQNIKPSSEGILDGITGEPVSVKPGSIAQPGKGCIAHLRMLLTLIVIQRNHVNRSSPRSGHAGGPLKLMSGASKPMVPSEYIGV